MSISGKIVKNGNVIIEVAETAELIVEGELICNNNLPVGSGQECVIRLYNNARMVVKGILFLNYGTTIQVFESGVLEFGSGVINSNTVIGVDQKIVIGDEFYCARNAVIYDSNFHDIFINGEKLIKSKPVYIGNHVWLGINVTVLKGVTIGDGCMIGAGSVVTNDIFPESMAAGNPAKVIKQNVRWEA